ncbi:MAG: rod shape-determining protein [Clostridia bacterium]|nr:rod shape-determining protein [Clostridia bacterium]
MGLFNNFIGIDMGTSNTKIYYKDRGIVLREPTVVAIDNYDETIRAAGNEAKEMLGRTPKDITAVRPIQDGVIADLTSTETMLRRFVKEVCGTSFFSKPRAVIAVPFNVTEVERHAVKQAAAGAGVRDPRTVDEPMAAAIGAGLPIAEATGSMIVDIGGGLTEVAVISYQGIVSSCSVKIAGDDFDDAIVDYVRRKYNIAIGGRTAEEVKINIGSAYPYENEGRELIKGRNIIDGLPRELEITASEVREALSDSVAAILEAVRSTLEKTPPELSADLIERGIMLCGGSALLRGIDTVIAQETGMPVYIAPEPTDCVAIGAGMMLEHIDEFDNDDSYGYRMA